MGAHVARVIRERLAGRVSSAFHYRDFGNLATVGRLAAVVDLRGFRLSGALAWFFWLFAHIFFLIGFRNRIVVFIDWIWSYFTYQRNARIIIGTARDEDT
jgi:NADH dehydrogenase